MNERGSVLLESLVAWTLLGALLCLTALAAARGARHRLREYEQFRAARAALARP